MDLMTDVTEAAPELMPEDLQAEANAALGAAPVDPALAPAPEPNVYDPERVTEWEPYTHMAIQLLANVGLPQWEITDDEKNELIKSTAHILEDLFPGGINGRFAPYFRLLSVGGIICITRYKTHGGKLPGIGPRLVEKKADINGTL